MTKTKLKTAAGTAAKVAAPIVLATVLAAARAQLGGKFDLKAVTLDAIEEAARAAKARRAAGTAL